MPNQHPKRLLIERFCDNLLMGTFGRTSINGEFKGYSVEQPWQDNKPFKSCIPTGDYEVVAYDSQKYGRTLALKNLALGVGVFKGESERYAILIHPANIALELEGCIAFGTSLGFIKSAWAVTGSAVKTKEILNSLKAGDKISIIWKSHP